MLASHKAISRRRGAVGRLTAKRVLLTGAGGLMGSDLARSFAAEGADLVLTTRTRAKLEPLAAEIRALGNRVTTVAADFTKREDVDRLAEKAWDAFGGIDVVLLSSQPANPRNRRSSGDRALPPGLICTGENVREFEQAVRAYGMLSRTSLGRVGRSRECIGAALYLASEESSFTSGQCIGVDGGRF
jgi:NAD(P)-dependent dehydrogenase (short-subunit alcohol dehydrogenase family)